MVRGCLFWGSWVVGLVVWWNACAGDSLDFILDDAMGPGSEEGGEKQEPGMVQQLSRTMTSLNRFMKSLQN